MTRMRAYIASLLLLTAASSSANVPAFAGGIIKGGIGITSSVAVTKKKPKRGCILPCMDRWCLSGCCGQGGCIYNCVESMLSWCCSCLPSCDEWCNCNPDCCRSSVAKGLDRAGNTQIGALGPVLYLAGFGFGAGSNMLSENVESSSEEETNWHSQLNTVFNMNLGAYGLVASLDSWGFYLGGSIATNPLSNGARFKPFKGVLSSRREDKDLYQSLFYLTFGPRAEYAINSDFSAYAGLEVGLARVSNYIPQSPAADRIIATKSPSIHGTLKIAAGLTIAINDDVSGYIELARYVVNCDPSSRAFGGRQGNQFNANSSGTAQVSAGLEFKM